MANSTVYVMESANLICGDTRSPENPGAGGGSTTPGVTTHLILQELKLPALEENTVDHAPAGAPMAIEVPTHFNKLEATFNLAGWDSAVMSFVGQTDAYHQRFTAYGLIRDRRTSVALQAIAVIEGRLGRMNPTAFSKGNLMAHEYSIKSIVSYRLSMQKAKNASPVLIYKWDFFTSKFESGRFNLNNDLTSLLGIPSSSIRTSTG